jgi:hypothetical protein
MNLRLCNKNLHIGLTSSSGERKASEGRYIGGGRDNAHEQNNPDYCVKVHKIVSDKFPQN